jgi:hypothetical protein
MYRWMSLAYRSVHLEVLFGGLARLSCSLVMVWEEGVAVVAPLALRRKCLLLLLIMEEVLAFKGS